MSTAERLELMLAEMSSAISGFERSLEINLEKFSEDEIDTLKNGQVHKFIYCSELCWKTAKIYLEDKRGLVLTAPKIVFKSLFTEQIIDEEMYLTLISIVSDRNELTHIYKEELFMEILPKLPTYADCMKLLLNKLKN